MNELRVLVLVPNQQRARGVQQYVQDVVHELADSYPGRGVIIHMADSTRTVRGMRADYLIACEGINKEQWLAAIPSLAREVGAAGRIITIGEVEWA